MEEAIKKFMDGMEEQERSGFKNMHQFLEHLPVPTVKKGQTMTHTDAMEGGFLPSMTDEEQERFTPSELLLYKHALEYRYEPSLFWCIPRMYKNIPSTCKV
jgi:hypothetical protein